MRDPQELFQEPKSNLAHLILLAPTLLELRRIIQTRTSSLENSVALWAASPFAAVSCYRSILVVETMQEPLVGVLALQGAFEEHQKSLEAIGCRTRQVFDVRLQREGGSMKSPQPSFHLLTST